jgi:hypothetical protein
MTNHARLAILLTTIVGCVCCDQVTKQVAREHLNSGSSSGFSMRVIGIPLLHIAEE